MHVGMCVRLWESPSPRWADARHGALAGVHTLYSLYNPLHGERVGTCSLQRLYSLYILYLLYSSTSLHPLQYTSLYITPQALYSCTL